MTTLPDAADLLELTAALVDVPSVSGDEARLAEEVAGWLRAWAPGLSLERVGDNLVARTDVGAERRVVLAGHLDTVPPAGNARACIEGDTLRGLGAADMKGGLAVMLALAAEVAARAPRLDVTFVFYACEEVAEARNGLRALFAERPDLVAGDLAVLLEPTNGWLEAGCQGTLRMAATFRGARAHTARAWLGVNAIHRAAPVLARLAAASEEMRAVEVDGLAYREGLQVVSVSGGVAGNVVPDECVVVVNRRFAPSRTLDEAIDATSALLAGADEVEVTDAATAAAPNLRDPLVVELVDTLGLTVRPKLGWTDVARFAEHRIPAVNYGPGDAELAHTAGECITRPALDQCAHGLRRFIFAEE